MINEDGDMPEEYDDYPDDFDQEVGPVDDFREPDTLHVPQVIHTDENILIDQDFDEPPSADESARVAEPGAMSDLFSNLVALPPDPSSVDFRQAIQALRSNFEERQTYNNMVCDQLAMRGMPPNGSNVLDVGGWGTKSAVVADVRNWYASLALRLSAQHAAIPEAARRQANQLFEQLWSLAVQTAMNPYTALQQDMVGLQARLDLQTQEANELRRRHDTQLQQMQFAIDEGTSELRSVRAALEGAQDAVRVRDRRVNELENSISLSALAHRDALLEQGRVHATEVRQVQEAAAHERATLVTERDRLSDELARQRDAYEVRLATKEAQSREDAKAHALALDRARQDVREANARADAKMNEAVKLREETFALREQISQLQVASAKIEMELARVRAEKKR